jgi:hypothetical protein
MERKYIWKDTSTPREKTCARAAATADCDVNSIDRESLRCFTRVLKLNTKHDRVLRVSRRQSIIQAWIGVGGIEQDIRDKNSTHAHTECRGCGKRAAKRFAERGSSSKTRRRDRTVDGGWVRWKCKFQFTSRSVESYAGKGEGGLCAYEAWCCM